MRLPNNMLYFQSHLESQSCKVAVSSPKASWPRLQNFSAAFFLPTILFSLFYITEASVQYISLVTWVDASLISYRLLRKRQHFTTASMEFKLTSVITSLDPPAQVSVRHLDLILDPQILILICWSLIQIRWSCWLDCGMQQGAAAGCPPASSLLLLLQPASSLLRPPLISLCLPYPPTNLPPGHPTPREPSTL